MTGAEQVAAALAAHGLRRVFSHAGGTISYLLDAIQRAGIEVVVARQETQAIDMARGAYRASGKTQVALVTSGPGATNAVTGIASAYYDADAVLLLCGQVATTQMRGERPIRQWGFQECPTVAIMRPIAKAAFGLCSVGIELQIDSAIRYALSPRPGPVVIDVPMDLQK